MIAGEMFTAEDMDLMAAELSRLARDIRRQAAGCPPDEVRRNVDRIVLHCQETGRVEVGMCYAMAATAIAQAGPELLLSVLMDLVVATAQVAADPRRN